MIFGVGTDIVEVVRFQRFLDTANNALIERIFTSTEIATCNARKGAASCFAARFAAKEAFLKALGSGLRDGISWHDMEVTNNELGKPEMSLTGKADEQFREHDLSAIHLSLSHDGGNAIAMVVLES